MEEIAHATGVIAGGAGLLGLSASGVVDALGKGLLGRRGLPMRGFRAVDRVIGRGAPVLRAALGDDYRETLAAQYRDGRGHGRAPATVRAALAAGLDRLAGEGALDDAARALGLPPAADAAKTRAEAERALGAAFDAAFSLAESEYRSAAKLAAGAVALALSLGVWITLPAETRAEIPLYQALLAGLVAVPLAPMAKDIAKAIEGVRAAQAG